MRLVNFPMDSGSSAETSCLVVRYRVLGFRRGEEGSRKLTGQLVALHIEDGEVGQIANALGQLCRNELLSREILRTGILVGRARFSEN